jgi:hypothetical protein
VVYIKLVATALVGFNPNKSKIGVRINPPPTPKNPDNIPTVKPTGSAHNRFIKIILSIRLLFFLNAFYLIY